MDLVAWASLTAAIAAAFAVVVYLYRRRETPGRGRWLLAGLRWAALSLLILLIFDPELPVPGFAVGRDDTRVLVDASLSMGLPVDTAGESRWSRAAEEARRVAGGGDVILFGETPGTVPADSLPARAPAAAASRLLPALRIASEAGARRVVVVTDGGLEDAADVTRAARSLGIEIEARSVDDGGAANVAVAEMRAPAWARAGDTIDVRVGVTALGAVGDSVDVALRQGDTTLARARVPVPDEGRVAAATLRVTPASPGAEGGLVRYDAVLDVDDDAADDDRRSVYVHVSERPSGVVLLSFRPDWEPRFLHPTLDRALGMPVQGFLRTADDRYIVMGAGADAATRVAEADVRRAAGKADMVVLHGLGGGSPAWARELVGSASSLLVFPGPDAADLDLPVRLPPPGGGEWYPVAEVPASPVASLLTSLPIADLPPLTGVRVPRSEMDGWSPLELRRGRRGARAPLLAAGESGRRRWAVALADGYWRWAFRGGDARRAYRRIWSAVGGWLAEDRRGAALAAIRPTERVAERARPVRWIAPGVDADSIAFEVVPVAEDGADASDPADAVEDATNRPSAGVDRFAVVFDGDTVATPSLSPGHYRYRARAFADGRTVATAEGPFTVAGYSPEFTRRRVALGRVAGDGGAEPESPGLASAAGRPLHTTPWPYALLVLALCAEWVLRRRWGLR